MRIKLNGQDATISDHTTIAQLLDSIHLDPRRAAVEVNEDLVTRGDFAHTRISDGDRIEVVTLVGGG